MRGEEQIVSFGLSISQIHFVCLFVCLFVCFLFSSKIIMIDFRLLIPNTTNNRPLDTKPYHQVSYIE